MFDERFTLTLRHELISTTDEGIKVYQMEPPLNVCVSLFEKRDREYIIYGVNEALDRLEHEFLERFNKRNEVKMDGGADEE